MTEGLSLFLLEGVLGTDGNVGGGGGADLLYIPVPPTSDWPAFSAKDMVDISSSESTSAFMEPLACGAADVTSSGVSVRMALFILKRFRNVLSESGASAGTEGKGLVAIGTGGAAAGAFFLN